MSGATIKAVAACIRDSFAEGLDEGVSMHIARRIAALPDEAAGVSEDRVDTVWSLLVEAGDESLRYTAEKIVAALSPQTLPAPPLSTDVQSAATGFHEQDVSLEVTLPAPGEVEIKPLSWTEPHASHTYPNWYARVFSIQFEARIDTGQPLSYGKFPLSINGAMVGKKFETVDEAKAHAQADYAARVRGSLATVAAANDEGVADYPDQLLDRVAEAITRAQCPGREGPYGGYDYGHRREDDLPRDGRYVVRDFRDVTSEAFGAWVHQTPDVAVHEAAFDRLTKRHIARAALDAAARLATSRSQHEGADNG